jgi:hypothetical protein
LEVLPRVLNDLISKRGFEGAELIPHLLNQLIVNLI